MLRPVEPEGESFFEFTAHVLRWEEAFRALAVRRIGPLLLRAGVPEMVARSPEPVQDRATAFLLAVKDVPLKVGGEKMYRAAVESLLRGTFEELKIAVGPVVTEQLRAWLMRSFVDHDERMRLWIWSLLLPRLAGAYGHSAKTPPPLPTARMQRFNDIVRSYFSPEIRQEDDDLAERARREPLSLLEQELVPARITDSVDSDDPDDDVWPDELSSLRQAIRIERARRAWDEVEKIFTPRERTMLVAWARQEGALRKMPLHLIATRSIEK